MDCRTRSDASGKAQSPRVSRLPILMLFLRRAPDESRAMTCRLAARDKDEDEDEGEGCTDEHRSAKSLNSVPTQKTGSHDMTPWSQPRPGHQIAHQADPRHAHGSSPRSAHLYIVIETGSSRCATVRLAQQGSHAEDSTQGSPNTDSARVRSNTRP